MQITKQMLFWFTNTHNHHRIRIRNVKSNGSKNGKQEYKDEHAKRSSVEGPFGILKEQFQIEKEVVIGMLRTEEKLYLDALPYNLIRIQHYTRN